MLKDKQNLLRLLLFNNWPNQNRGYYLVGLKSLNRYLFKLFLTLSISTILHCTFNINLFAESKVVILRSQDLHAYNLAIEGFITECDKNDIKVQSVADMSGKLSEGRKIINKFIAGKEKPDMFLAVGVLAATLAKKTIKDVPVLFCMVVNYQRFRLEGKNISGIASEIPEKECFVIYKNIVTGIKNLGVIYDEFKTKNIIENGKKISYDLGLNLINVKVKSAKEVKDALVNIIDKIDALWLAPDSTVISKSTFPKIYDLTVKNKKPIFCTSDVFVKAGALIGVFPDYINLGIQAGKLARRILKDGEDGPFKVEYPEKLKIAINKKTEKRIKVKISDDVYKLYDVVEYW